MLIRDLTVSVAAALKAVASTIGEELSARLVGPYIDLTVDSESSWAEVVNSLIAQALDVVKVKVDRGIRAPKLNKNDLKYVFSRIGLPVDRGSTYIDAFYELIARHGSALAHPVGGLALRSLGMAASADKHLLLGVPSARERSSTYALPQIFKVEAYEKGSAFHRPYTHDFSVRLTDAWLTLLAIGFSLTYLGMYGGQVAFITPTEEALSSNVNARLTTALSLASSLLRASPDPIIPYAVYLALTIPDVVIAESPPYPEIADVWRFVKGVLVRGDGEAAKELSREGRVPSLNMHRLGVGRAFTALSRESLNLSRLLHFAYVLDEVSGGRECRQRLRNGLVRRALGAVEPKLVNAVTLLYEAAHSAKDARYVTYTILRIASEVVQGDLRRRRELLSPECVTSILTALERVT